PQGKRVPMRHVAVVAGFLLLVASLSGCGDGKQNVSGTVTLDGTPLETGTIAFVKTEGGAVREGGTIKNGEFSARVPNGHYKVEIAATKVGAKVKRKYMDKEEEIEQNIDLVPEKYNTKSELSADVKGATPGLKFDLKSK